MWREVVEPDRPQMTTKHGTEKVQEHRDKIITFITFPFHSNNDYVNKPQYYVTCSLPVLLYQ